MTRTPAARPPGYLDRAELHAGRPLARREEVGALLAAAGADPALSEEFDRALFLAKFWESATAILRRAGPGSDDVRKLAGELADTVRRVEAVLAKLFDAGAPGRAAAYRERYLPGHGGSLAELGALLADLALLKNFELHGEGR